MHSILKYATEASDIKKIIYHQKSIVHILFNINTLSDHQAKNADATLPLGKTLTLTFKINV